MLQGEYNASLPKVVHPSLDSATEGSDVVPVPDCRKRLSIRSCMEGSVVFLTGATGYLGSLVLEQLLRTCPGVTKIYVLARGKGKATAQQRIHGLLHVSPLFELVRAAGTQLTDKVEVVEGDLAASNTLRTGGAKSGGAAGHGFEGELPPDLLPKVTHVIHAAARIVLEDGIQTTLLHNYCGTRHMLDLARQMPHLRCFTHVSSAFANVELPLGSTAEERVYPLVYGDRELDHEALVAKLLACSPVLAEAKAASLLQLWGFPNTYSLGKRLTELMVRDQTAQFPAPVVIARPSFIGAVAGHPSPGYSGNLAGPSGYAVAFGLGMFIKDAPAWHTSRMLDNVPGDVASSVVLAATAAVGAGWESGCDPCNLSRDSIPSAASTSLEAHVTAVPSAADGETCRDRVLQLAAGCDTADAGRIPMKEAAWQSSAKVTAAAASQQLNMQRPRSPIVIHSASSTVNPLFNLEAYTIIYDYFTKHPPRLKLFFGSYAPPDIAYSPNPRLVKRAKAKVSRRVSIVSTLLNIFGKKKQAHRLEIGLQQWLQGNCIKNDILLYFSSSAALALEAGMDAEERHDFPLIWRGSWPEYWKIYLDQLSKRYLGGSRT